MSGEKPLTVFVTGGSGFIGSKVVRLLLKRGYNVKHASLSGRAVDGLEGIAMNLRDVAAVTAAMQGSDIVIHLAGRSGGIQLQATDNADLFEANNSITRAVLSAAQHAKVQKVFIASSAVAYAEHGPEPIREVDRLVAAPDNPSGYAWSKVCDEVVAGWYHKQNLFSIFVGRFTNIYGPGSYQDPSRATVVHSLIKKCRDAAPSGVVEVWGDGTAFRSFMFVDDAAQAVLDILDCGVSGEAYNIDSGEAVTIRQLAEAVRDTVAPGVTLEFNASKPSGPQYRVLSSAKLRSLEREPPKSLREGLRLTVEEHA